MLYHNVCVEALACTLPDEIVGSDEIESRLAPLYRRLRLPEGRFRFVTLPCLDTAGLTGSRAERIESICRFYTDAVERMVRMYPEQWFWMLRRWKTSARRPSCSRRASRSSIC